tara:strand:+ start:261 stop:632 length:372 start_codon:yes stop_codon:yes gene_type:complete
LDNESDGAHTHGDRTRILQVIADVSNATKSSPKEGTIQIHAETQERVILISVTDYGLGIPEEFQSQIFEKFTQADSSDTRRISGTGLGLAIFQAIIKHHQGSIGFTTKVVIGTTFHVTIPLQN